MRKILVVRLRSIGDTVLTTPALASLRKFLPKVQIDILLEDWVAPVLDGADFIDRVIVLKKSSKRRLMIARELRSQRYDVAFNLHGGPTSALLVRASGAKYRVGYSNYQFSSLHNRRLSSAKEFWGTEKNHSAERQMALFGFLGVPVSKNTKTILKVTGEAERSLAAKTRSTLGNLESDFAVIHPAAAFDSKQWSTQKFADIAGYLSENGIRPVAITSEAETELLKKLETDSRVPMAVFNNLTLPETSALTAKSKVFVGNDSGIAHIAAAVGTSTVVIFGSSNRDHWRPWTDAPNEIVYEEFQCQPCAGHVCEEYDKPMCIRSVGVDSVKKAIETVLNAKRS